MFKTPNFRQFCYTFFAFLFCLIQVDHIQANEKEKKKSYKDKYKERNKDTEDKANSDLISKYKSTADTNARNGIAKEIFQSASTTANFQKFLKAELKKEKAAYQQALLKNLRSAYLKRLPTLSDRELRLVIETRRMWESYHAVRGGYRFFKELFIKSVHKSRDILIPDLDHAAENIEDETLKKQREHLYQIADHVWECYGVLKINPDPTVNMKCPKGDIPYTTLIKVPTERDQLYLMERYVGLMALSHPDAHRILTMNLDNANVLEYEENEFTYFGNMVRMVTGTNAWVAHPLLSNCARDHSKDRKEGNASGHTGKLPGKGGFGQRAARMGAPRPSSEGAGGGNGVGAIMGLSYGGGHTGPLYSSIRNLLGIGWHKGPMTGMYARSKKYDHRNAVVHNFVFLPPSFDEGDLTGKYRGLFPLLQAKKFGEAHALLVKIKAKTDKEKFLHRYFTIVLEVEAKHMTESLMHFIRSGDVTHAEMRLEAARKYLAGVPYFDRMALAVEDILTEPDTQKQVMIGRLFYQTLFTNYTQGALDSFAKKYADSIYGQAAASIVKDKMGAGIKGFSVLGFFEGKYKPVANFIYKRRYTIQGKKVVEVKGLPIS